MKQVEISLFLALTGGILFNPINLFGQSPAFSRESESRILQVEKSLAGQLVIEGERLGTIEQRMKMYNVPAVSIAVIKDYKIDWAKAYGYADVAGKKAASTQTLFQAASLSKSINAIGLIKLAQDKKIDLYADINNYLSSWKFPYDSISKNKKISIANILTHTAGLTVHGFRGYRKTEQVPSIIEILNGSKPSNSVAIRSKAEPGIKSEYSGGGTTISQLIVVDVTGQPYEKYTFENILRPMGMNSSFYSALPTAVQQKNLATAYNSAGQEVPGKYHLYPELAAAALWTNPTDFAKYIIETQLSLLGKSNKVLSTEMTKLRLTPYPKTNAGMGVFIDNRGNDRYFQHSGGNEGFRCQYFGSVEGGNGVIVMVNSDNGVIIDEIINSVATTYNWKDFYKPRIKKIVSVSDAVLSSYIGRYELNPQFILTITKEGNQIKGQATGQGQVDLFPEAENKFFLKVVDAQLEFVKNENGKISKAILYQGGAKMEARKIE